MGQIANHYSGLFHDDDASYYEQLDVFAEPLRSSAHNIVDFIENLGNKTQELKNLRDSYSKLESMPAKNLCTGIENIKTNLLKVEFISKSVNASTKEQREFIDFFELQNAFNYEVNAFVKKVIQLEMIN